MQAVPSLDVAAYISYLLLVLALISWTVLWAGRSRSVHLWASGVVASAVFVLFTAGPALWAGVPLHVFFPAYATVACLSVGLRVEALRGLLGRAPAGQRLAVAAVLSCAGGVVLATAPTVRDRGADIVLVAMFVGLAWCAWLALELWRTQAIVNARLLAVALGVPTLPGLAVAVASVVDGEAYASPSLDANSLQAPALALNVLLACCNAALFIGVVFERQRRDTERALNALAASSAERSRLEERSRIVDDLHDGFGSQLVSARLKVEQGVLSQAAVANLLQECVSDLYLLVDTMNTSNGSVGEALRFFRHRTQDRLAGLPLTLHWQLDVDAVPSLPHSDIIQLLRIVQEALTNALRHASARNLWIVAGRDLAGRLLVSVADDGVGFDERSLTNGHGLRSMRGRADGLGGTLHVSPLSPGTRVELLVPLPVRRLALPTLS